MKPKLFETLAIVFLTVAMVLFFVTMYYHTIQCINLENIFGIASTVFAALSVITIVIADRLKSQKKIIEKNASQKNEKKEKKAETVGTSLISRGDVALLVGAIETVAIVQAIMSLGGLALAMSGKGQIMLVLLIVTPVLAVISSILHELPSKRAIPVARILDRVIVLLVPLVLLAVSF